MKMNAWEKFFVNSRRQSRRVSRKAAARIERLQALAPAVAGRTYLDVGCGNGAAVLHVAAKFGLLGIGVDVDPDQIRLARDAAAGRKDAGFIVADGSRLPIADGRFDLVATTRSTHHVEAWQDALREMLRVLKPGGWLLYSDFILPGWIARLHGGPRRRQGAGAAQGPPVPTRAALDAIAAREKVRVVWKSSGFLWYEAFWQRPPETDRAEANGR